MAVIVSGMVVCRNLGGWVWAARNLGNSRLARPVCRKPVMDVAGAGRTVARNFLRTHSQSRENVLLNGAGEWNSWQGTSTQQLQGCAALETSSRYCHHVSVIRRS